MAGRILVVEDDRGVAEGLREVFEGRGYGVELASGTEEALELLRARTADMAVLDVSLGAESGYGLCRRIREFSDLPILFLTARSGEADLVEGFGSGGDDYLTKPFRVRELIARVEALMRRTRFRPSDRLVTGELVLDQATHTLTLSGEPVKLSGVEWDILSALMLSWPRALTREELFYRVWDKDAKFVEENTLSVNISRLREKLGGPEGRARIETVRGVGYRWGVPVRR